MSIFYEGFEEELKYYRKAFNILNTFLRDVREHFNHPNSGCLTYPDGIKSAAEKAWKKLGELEED